ncbi:MAG: heavy metal-responsive transcriptional regulator [Nitrospirae bacterium]|nr:heavy metal-responsive transcriptional regulator [Nitrospirota bacterium]
MNRLLRIGEVGEKVGLNPKTIRYYEEIGLLPKPRRSEVIHGKGYRLYTQEDLNRLLFIKRAKLLGLSLAQIRELLVSTEEGCCGSARPHLTSLLEQKLTEIEERIQELKHLHHHLNWLKHKTAQGTRAQKASSSCASTASPSDCVFIEYPAQGTKRLPKGENVMTDHIPLTTVEQAGECCEPLCPDMCGPSGSTPTQGPIKTKTVTAKDKVVKLTKVGVQRLFNGKDNKIFTRDDLIETRRNGWIKVAGRCSGQIWHVRRDEIIKIEKG